MHSEGRYGLERGLAGWWRLKSSDEGVNDIIGTNNGTLNGGMGFGTVGGRACAIFDGTDDYVVIGSAISGVDLSENSVSMWFCPTDNLDSNIGTPWESTFPPVDCRSLFTQWHRWCLIYNQGKLIFYCSSSGGVAEYAVDLAAGEWHHIAATFQVGSGMNLYLDGILVATASATSDLQPYGTDINVGRTYDDNGSREFFYGSINDVRIYNRALSAAEVARLARIY